MKFETRRLLEIPSLSLSFKLSWVVFCLGRFSAQIEICDSQMKSIPRAESSPGRVCLMRREQVNFPEKWQIIPGEKLVRQQIWSTLFVFFIYTANPKGVGVGGVAVRSRYTDNFTRGAGLTAAKVNRAARRRRPRSI